MSRLVEQTERERLSRARWAGDVPELARIALDEGTGDRKRRKAIRYLVRRSRDPWALEALGSLVETGRDEERVPAAAALARRGKPAVVYLRAALEDDCPAVAALAADGLGRARDVESFPRLVDLLRADGDELRLSTVRALGRIGDRRAVEPLRRLRGREGVRGRWRVLAALLRLRLYGAARRR